MPGIVYLNGEFVAAEDAKISVFDRGFLFADGIYEVIPVFQGQTFGLEGHLARLDQSLNAIGIKPFKTVEQWAELFSRLISENGAGNLALYVQITRGVQSTRQHNYPEDLIPSVFAMVQPVTAPLTDVTQSQAINAVVLNDNRWTRCDIKSTSLLPNILLKQQAQDAGAQEAVLIRDGKVTEAAAANVFVVKDGVIMTPPKSSMILAGITRDLIVKLAHQHHIACEEREISEAMLRNAEEIWISSSTREIVPVAMLDGQKVGDALPGPVWTHMARCYQEYKQSFFAKL